MLLYFTYHCFTWPQCILKQHSATLRIFCTPIPYSFKFLHIPHPCAHPDSFSNPPKHILRLSQNVLSACTWMFILLYICIILHLHSCLFNLSQTYSCKFVPCLMNVYTCLLYTHFLMHFFDKINEFSWVSLSQTDLVLLYSRLKEHVTRKRKDQRQIICDDAKDLMLPDSFLAWILFKALIRALVIWSHVCSQVFLKIYEKEDILRSWSFFHTLPHVGCYCRSTGHYWGSFQKKLIWNYTILATVCKDEFSN